MYGESILSPHPLMSAPDTIRFAWQCCTAILPEVNFKGSEHSHSFFPFSFIDSFDLHFRPNGNSYAIIEGDIPDLTSFSSCFWLKLAEATPVKQAMTLISYSNLKYQKAFLLSTRGLSINIYAQDSPVL